MPAEAPESNLQFVNDTQANLKNNASSATIAGGQTINDLSALNVDLIDLATVNDAKGGEGEIKERIPGRQRRIKTSRNIANNVVSSDNTQKTILATEPSLF